MKPYVHAKISAKRFGGIPEDYMQIHDFMDSSKMAYADIRHRALLHNSFGVYLAERVFGTNIMNSEQKLVSVRDIAEHHVAEDLGFIPTIEKWLNEIPLKDWMTGRAKKTKDFDVTQGD